MVTLDNWEKHVGGKKHKHNIDMSLMKYKECTLCNVVFTGRHHMKDHIKGKKHRVYISFILETEIFFKDNVKQNGGHDPVGDWRDHERDEGTPN